ncbi:transmembrane protein 6/97 [Phialemonium atrogriseum]|uniref:Efficient mitochondria targeting-associated protein 19 n=1 Tax=Phialemonium atrogriseum TaxID=1093897 RepID=A0AAJ0C3P2_9PEZI|nr:transmembrane protein 6/97 [Phialemonium atrogriseum]KAK1768154.1 transmembrane protein 6/97 [Phialemonium atrogriseum]
MASSKNKNNWKDYIWLAWFSLQVLVIIFVDAVPFYPKHLYEPPGSPLHLLQRIRTFYVATYNDPIVQWTPALGRDSWIPLFTRIEMLFQLPAAAYAVHRLGRRRRAGTTGADELLYLVYALETALTTLVCLNDVLWWDDVVYPAGLKRVFIFQIYGPWFAIRK